jgi:ParB family chromosome partitioning protein
MSHTSDKRKALGRGLETLLPAARAVPAPVTVMRPAGSEEVREIPLEHIDVNQYQSRVVDPQTLEELAASIRQSGVMQPIIVRPVAGGRFQLIAGERRWRASERAGKKSIPAIVREVSNEKAMELTIIENLQREDLKPMEQARAFARLGEEFGLTQEEIAERTGKPRSEVANYLRLLKLPGEVVFEVEMGKLTFGHAKVLMALDVPEMLALAQKIIKEALSVRQTEELLWAMQEAVDKPARPAKKEDPNVIAAQQALERALGMKVEIRDRKGRGRVIIRYASIEDFDRLLAAVAGKAEG